MEHKRQQEIDWLRGFAAFLVVLGHSIIVFPVNLHEVPWCGVLYRTISSFHMPLFFAISGYCFSMRNGYKSYLLRKAKLLLLPYLCFSAVGIILKLLFPGLVNGTDSLKDSVINVILYGGEYWFLYALFLIFVVFPAIVPIIDRWEPAALILVVLSGLFCGIATSLLCLDRVSFYLIPFTAGYIARRHEVFRYRERIRSLSIIHRSVISILCILVLFLGGYVDSLFDSVAIRVFRSLTGVAACFFLSLSMPDLLSCFGPFSEYSLPLYLLNGYWLVISRTLAVSILGITNALLIILINMLIDFVLSYYMIRFVFFQIPLVREVLGIH